MEFLYFAATVFCMLGAAVAVMWFYVGIVYAGREIRKNKKNSFRRILKIIAYGPLAHLIINAD